MGSLEHFKMAERSKNNVFPNQSNNERSQQSKGYSMTTVGDIFDKAVDKTLNNKDFMNWAASTTGSPWNISTAFAKNQTGASSQAGSSKNSKKVLNDFDLSLFDK